MDTTKEMYFHFGKLKGEKLSNVSDLSYLEWMVKNVKLSDRHRTEINQRIIELRHNLK